MDILDHLNMVVGEATLDKLKKDIQKEAEKGHSKAEIWNRIKRMYRNIKIGKFEKVYNSVSLNDSTVTSNIAKNKAKGYVDVMGMKRRKKKREMKTSYTCYLCNGEGVYRTPKVKWNPGPHPCSVCRGSGEIDEKTHIQHKVALKDI